MMGRRLVMGGLAVVLLAALALATPAGGVAFAQEKDGNGGKVYLYTNIRGRLVDPETGEPMAGATVRFLDTSEHGGEIRVKTDAEGRFVAERLPYGIYALEITTADGERIQGVNTMPLGQGKGYEVELRISRRVTSRLGVENRPIRFAVWTEKRRDLVGRFWRQFFLFWTTAAAGFAAM